jgi:large subunit ribosomal protein L24e
MKRNPRKLAWTKSFRAAHGKEMTVDSTLSFAARRNVPVRYNRDLVATTLKAMQRVSEIRAKRERQFYKNRMRGNKERDLEADRKLVAENQHLLPPAEREAAQKLLEDESEMLDVVDELDEEEEEELEKQQLAQQKLKQKKKQRLVRGSGPVAFCFPSHTLSWRYLVTSFSFLYWGLSFGEKSEKHRDWRSASTSILLRIPFAAAAFYR